MENPLVNLISIVATIIICAGMIPTIFLLAPGGDRTEPEDD